jgi:multiple antibiotic resistance protein
MDQFFLALSSLIVVVGPWKAAVIFAERTTSLSMGKRRLVAAATVAISLTISVLFLVVGEDIVEFFHIDESAFLIAAGLLILVFAIRMVILDDQHGEATEVLDEEQATTAAWKLAAYPLSVPLLVTPAAMATLVSLSVQASTNDESVIALIAALLVVMAINLVVFLVEAQWEELIPEEVWSIAGRILGVLLAGFGTMLIIEGLKAIGVAPR